MILEGIEDRYHMEVIVKKKYVFLFLVSIFIFPVFCFAKGDVVRLTRDDYGKVFYENENGCIYFIHHDYMVPGKQFVDVLDIRNESTANVTLFLKADVEGVVGALEEELLDNIEMVLYLDDVEIYNGMAKGLDYNLSGINLQDAIILKEFKKNETAVLRAETKLANDYSNKANKEDVVVTWKFYSQIGGDDPVEVANAEGKSEGSPLLYTVGGIAALAVVGIYIYGRRTGRWLLVFAPWTRMKLEIPKIELKEVLHPKNDKKNKIENVMIMEGSQMPDDEEGNLVLIGKIDKEEDAVFNEMKNVEVDDYIYVIYQGYGYKYQVYKIYDGKEGLKDKYKYEGKRILTLATCKEDPKKLDKIYLAYFVERK